MPLYEYYCADCRGKFETLISYQASLGDVACSKCHGTHVRKLISVVARSRAAGSDYGDYDTGTDSDDFAGESGGCACGGACNCGGH
ncbi:MAG TPA: zinc ribbon domain-containing protein [Ktedonobacterales bacterium]|nr:zinc ribbon domain-containing protein [Ktedonobacterales bacterium]